MSRIDDSRRLRDEEEEPVKKESFFKRIPKKIIILGVVLLIISSSVVSIYLTVKYVKYTQNINVTIINKYIEALELKTAYGYKHPEQKIDINIKEYAKNFLINKTNKDCGKNSQLELNKEDTNLNFMSCEFIKEIEKDKIANNITIFVPIENNKEIFSDSFNKYSNYSFFIGFNEGDQSLLDYDWILIDRQGRTRGYEFCDKYKNLCKYMLHYNSEEFKEFK